MREPQGPTHLADLLELLRSPPALHRQVGRGRAQVLADRDDVHADRSQVGESAHHLVLGLAHPEDHARFRDKTCGLRPAEDREAPGVRGGRPHSSLEPEDRLDVVVEHLGTAGEDGAKRCLVPLAVWNEHLDGSVWRPAAYRLDRLGEGLSPAVGEVVTGDGRHDGVSQSEAYDGLGHVLGLTWVEWQRVPRVDQAEAARPRTTLPVDHERGCAVGPAFREVRAARLLADGDEIEAANHRSQADHLLAHLDGERACNRACAANAYCGSQVDARGSQAPPERPELDRERCSLTIARDTGGRRRRKHPGARRAALGPSGPRSCAALADTASTTSAMVAAIPSAASEVTGLSAMPHGTMLANIARSGSTFKAKPCIDRPRSTLTPMAQIFARCAAISPDPDARIALEPGGARKAESASTSITSCSIRCT